jgi:hypothetical protein
MICLNGCIIGASKLSQVGKKQKSVEHLFTKQF